ncbi:MAG: hypothetical protein K2N87_16105, partial [Eubacterium sp.]|nr:hypothetical protein [Eubacterium sp.]
MITICIDCGASFIKAARFEDGRLTDNRKISAPGVQKQGLIFFPEKIRQLAGIVKENILVMTKGEEIHLCISNEMHGFVLTGPCGELYTDYISWQMEFGNIRIHENTSKELLCKEEIKEDIRRSGMPVRAGLPSANLFYLIRSGKLSGKELHFYTLGDYIIRFLSGIEPLCHPTNAGATGLFDLGTMEWNDTLIAYIGAENVQFPEIGVKKTEFEMEGIRIHCCPAIGDQQAALLGAGFMREEILSFNLGTGAQVSMLTRKPEWEENWQCRPYFNGYYLRTIPHIPSGRALNVYFRFVKSILKEYEIKISDEDIWGGICRATLKEETSCLEFEMG